MQHHATSATLLLATMLLALSAQQPARADDSWNYLSVKFKEEAIAKATGVPLNAVLAALRTQGAAAARNDAAQPHNTTSGQRNCSEAMFNNWAAHFNISMNETQRPAAMQRFCNNMDRVRAINVDPSITFW